MGIRNIRRELAIRPTISNGEVIMDLQKDFSEEDERYAYASLAMDRGPSGLTFHFDKISAVIAYNEYLLNDNVQGKFALRTTRSQMLEQGMKKYLSMVNKLEEAISNPDLRVGRIDSCISLLDANVEFEGRLLGGHILALARREITPELLIKSMDSDSFQESLLLPQERFAFIE